jgi:hypothetical protein
MPTGSRGFHPFIIIDGRLLEREGRAKKPRQQISFFYLV